MNKRKILYRILIIGFILPLAACSPENSGLIGYSYHNITAKYNAYFIANEKLQEVLLEIEEAHQNNFNRVLKVKAPIDTTIVNANKEKIEDVIKKASIAIQRHKVSKWVDDSYILVGIARMLNQEYEESIETFKYVNVNSKDEQTRYVALTYLIRTFTEYGELNNALAVIDFLNRQKLSKSTKRKFYQQAAYYNQVANNPNNLIKYLSAATELMRGGPEKAKHHFILGQLFQKSKLDAFAYENYKEVLNNRPPYELSFYARLNMAQVTELSKGEDVKKIRKYFEQLLKDGKNIEFRDKIYYEMAEFELKQGNIKEAIPYYKSSVKESVDNERQKSFSYHKLGLLYFDELKEYTLAQAYYDSAYQIMPKDEEIYPQVETRQSVLSDFIKQINTINENDSLLSLAKMDSTSLNEMFLTLRDERLQKEKEEAEREKRAKRIKSANTNATVSSFGDEPNLQTNTAPGGGFYFYDASTVGQGRNTFKRTWGDRSLQDNWRTESGQIFDSEESDEPNKEIVAEQEEKSQMSEEELLTQERDQFFSSIPFEAEKQLNLKEEMEVAYYKLGNIYNFDLQEKKEAVNTYETLLSKYPDTEYKAELLYLLYIYYKDKDEAIAETYSSELLAKFPNSIFAKLVENPNYREESNMASAKVKVIYENAYRLYESGNYKAATNEINKGLDNYPENDYEDNLKLLEALITGVTDGKNSYKFKLQSFLKDYPNSELYEFAKGLLAAIDDYDKKQQQKEKIKYIPFFEQAHYFVVVYENNKALSGILPEEIESFGEKFFPEEDLNAGNLVFDDENSMILLSEFKDKETAEAFYKKFNSDLSPLKNFSSLNFSNFIISKDNFQIFYQAKMVDSYTDFFKLNYEITQ
ncbi:tetratricopeptide repeat protein [Marivirga salinae]|uniref:Tetratricopeptide repeat protein n=1 Tax=Marivirga salinarum TaxID=3059078 RepID=A0AA51RD03_9BACT|nr:tetratricopeptide repeat protein [Marivirga sp. BDSF4-3]WMN12423.1 tetratricopeptide repeat protein [Marivirga sp. BDSF4-3]